MTSTQSVNAWSARSPAFPRMPRPNLEVRHRWIPCGRLAANRRTDVHARGSAVNAAAAPVRVSGWRSGTAGRAGDLHTLPVDGPDLQQCTEIGNHVTSNHQQVGGATGREPAAGVGQP